MKRTFLTLSNVKTNKLPKEFQGDDVRYSEDFVEHFLYDLTKEGDIVFDPFMGFGTTLIVAERMERVGYGIEYDPKRCAYVKEKLRHPERAIQGDSLKLKTLHVPDFDLCITSPPYMGKHHVENPFTAYSTMGGGYRQYLQDIRAIFEQVNAKLRETGRALVEVSNLKHADAPATALAFDIAAVLSEVMIFEGETIILWEPTYGFGYDHSYALLYSKRNRAQTRAD